VRAGQQAKLARGGRAPLKWREYTMIDFKDEITKYKPILTVAEVEDNVKDEVSDIMDLLQYISGKTSKDRV